MFAANQGLKPTRILGIDPGLRHCGWGVIESSGHALRYIASGTINPSPTLPLAERLAILHQQLQQIIALHSPQQVAIEESFVSMNGQSTLKLGQARGAIMLSLGIAGLPVSEYAARLVKKTVTGNGRAEKEQMQAMVKLLLPHSNATSPDAADALAIAICHAHHG